MDLFERPQTRDVGSSDFDTALADAGDASVAFYSSAASPAGLVDRRFIRP